jgi:hypothetical protein
MWREQRDRTPAIPDPWRALLRQRLEPSSKAVTERLSQNSPFWWRYDGLAYATRDSG